MSKLIRLNITPQTHVRATQSDRIFFRIPRTQLFPAGLKRLMRLERYNEYKESLQVECSKKKLVIPAQGMSIKFFIPVPRSWRPWQKEVMHLKLHQQKPDIDNLMKAVLDSLLPEDKNIGQIQEMAKFWVNNDTGWIEISIDKPIYDAMELPKSRKVFNLA